MKQPRKDVLREQLALAADEIIFLRRRLESSDGLIRELRGKRKPWWRRLLSWRLRG